MHARYLDLKTQYQRVFRIFYGRVVENIDWYLKVEQFHFFLK